MKAFYSFFDLFTEAIMPTLMYIGPGAGAGALIIFIAIVAGALLLFMGFLWYPIKRLFANKKKNHKKK